LNVGIQPGIQQEEKESKQRGDDEILQEYFRVARFEIIRFEICDLRADSVAGSDFNFPRVKT
jgi:hypothetical protein